MCDTLFPHPHQAGVYLTRKSPSPCWTYLQYCHHQIFICKGTALWMVAFLWLTGCVRTNKLTRPKLHVLMRDFCMCACTCIIYIYLYVCMYVCIFQFFLLSWVSSSLWFLSEGHVTSIQRTCQTLACHWSRDSFHDCSYGHVLTWCLLVTDWLLLFSLTNQSLASSVCAAGERAEGAEGLDTSSSTSSSSSSSSAKQSFSLQAPLSFLNLRRPRPNARSSAAVSQPAEAGQAVVLVQWVHLGTHSWSWFAPTTHTYTQGLVGGGWRRSLGTLVWLEDGEAVCFFCSKQWLPHWRRNRTRAPGGGWDGSEEKQQECLSWDVQ